MTMPETIFRDAPDESPPEDTLRQMLGQDEEIAQWVRSALALFERPDVIGAGEAAGFWGGTWLLPAVGRWKVAAVDMAAITLAVVLAAGGQLVIGPSIAENGLFLLAVVVLVAIAVSVSLWAKISMRAWVDEHNTRVERIRRRVKAERDEARRAQ